MQFHISKRLLLSLAAAVGLFVFVAFAQKMDKPAKDDSHGAQSCGPAAVIPVSGQEPQAKILVDPPLAGPLASRGVAIISYCTQNLHVVPVFGPGAVTASPRIGHIHVGVDDASWVWADASGNPIILQGLAPGPHKVRVDLVDANHHALDKVAISFVVPETATSEQHH